MLKIAEKSSLYNVNYALLERILGIISTIIMTSLLARKLGPEAFGLYQHYASIAFVATAMTWLVSAESLHSRLNASGSIDKEIFQTVFFLRFANGLLIFLVCLSYIAYNKDELAGLIIFIVFPFVFIEAFSTYKYILESSGRMYVSAVIRVFSTILKILFYLVIYYFDLSFYYIGLALALEAIVNSFLYYYVCSGLNYFAFPKLNLKLASDLVHSGLAVFIGLIALYLFQRIDRVIFSSKLTQYDFGQYAAALTIIDQVNTLTLIIINIIAAKFIYRESASYALDNFFKLLRIVVCISLLSIFLVLMFSGFAIKIIFGNGYTDSVSYIEYLCMLIPLFAIDSSLNVLIYKLKFYFFFILKYFIACFVFFLIIELRSGDGYLIPYDFFKSYVVCFVVMISSSAAFVYFKIRSCNAGN